jgi:hypothetical protein
MVKGLEKSGFSVVLAEKNGSDARSLISQKS